MKKFFNCCLIFLLIAACLITTCPTKNTIVEAQTTHEYNAKAYILQDYNSGEVLLAHNEDAKFEIASMVKLMTSLLTMEKIECGEWSLDTKLNVSEYAASMEGSQAFLDAHNTYTVEELLKSVIIASANDSSVVLAEGYTGTEQNFVEIMNEKAKELGMNNTLYANSTGLPALEQYSTARDVAKIIKEVCKHDLYHKYCTIWMDELVHSSGRRTELVNTNRLVKYFTGCDCGKTGFTDEAGYCLSASAKRQDMRLISVVMGAQNSADRFTISSNLLNYGFSNFENKLLLSSNEKLDTQISLKGGRENLELFVERDIYVLSKRGGEVNYELKYKLPNTVKAPIKNGEKIGTIYVVKDGVVVDEVNVIARQDYNKLGFKDSFKKIFDNWSF